MGLPGLRGLEGAQGKGIHGEKVIRHVQLWTNVACFCPVRSFKADSCKNQDTCVNSYEDIKVVIVHIDMALDSALHIQSLLSGLLY